MRLLRSLSFRMRRLLGKLPTGRPDTISSKAIRAWIRRHSGCLLESDLDIRGPVNALDFLKLDRGCAIDRGCIVWLEPESETQPLISLGERVYIGPYCYLGSRAPLTVGRDTIIGGYSYVITANHRSLPGIPVQDQGYDSAPVCIGEDVWIGCHVVVLPGVTIGDHAIIGAGAVVNRNVPAGEKWAGVPAKKIGTRT